MSTPTPPVLSELVSERLANWKFATALRYLEDPASARQLLSEDVLPVPEPHLTTIKALAMTFGNCGWFQGSMSDVVRAAVRSLGIED